MINNNLLTLLLSEFLTLSLGVIIYCGLFSYSFKRKKKFLLRLALSLLLIGGLSAGIALGVYYGFTHGVETTLANVEYIRMAANVLSLLSGIAALFICFAEEPALLLFATIMGYSSNGFASSVYAMLTDLTHTQSIYFSVYNGYSVVSFLIFYAVHITVFFTLFFTFARSFAKTTKSTDKNISKAIIGVFFIFSFIMTAIQGSNLFNPSYNGATIQAVSFTFNGIVALIYAIVIITLRFILEWTKTTQEKNAEKAFLDGYKEKIELQEKNMELVNLKCHDMKHQLRTLLEGKNLDSDFIEETQKTISIFDSQVKTGNATLDTLLTQKSLICDAQNVSLTVMIDGEALSFMSIQDINSFFGNALDNAVDYLLKVDKEKRFIRISSFQQGDIFTVRIENYCDEPLIFKQNGLPLTTKEDNGYHGFGTKSIKTVAKKYGGEVSFARVDDLFILTAIFMR